MGQGPLGEDVGVVISKFRERRVSSDATGLVELRLTVTRQEDATGCVVQVHEEENDLGGQGRRNSVENDLASDINHLDVGEAVVVEGLVNALVVLDSSTEVGNSELGILVGVVRRGQLGGPNVLLNNVRVLNDTLEEHHLDVLLSATRENELAARLGGIGGVVNSDRAPSDHPFDHVVQGGDSHVQALLLGILVVGVEELMGQLGSNTLAAVLADVKDAARDADPGQVASDLSCNVSLSTRR